MSEQQLTILDLPNEILHHVATFLKSKDLYHCTTTNERFYSICGEYNLWKKYFVDIETNNTPQGRLCHTGAVCNNKMYIFGGHITQPSTEFFHSVKQDLFEFDFDTRKWNEYTYDSAPRRTEHTAVFYNNQMLVFGGYSGGGYENSVMVFDTITKKWSQLVTFGEIPTARSAHTSVVVGHTMYIFGGWNGNYCMNDLHALDLRTNTWKQITPSTAASPRTSSAQTVICTGTAPVARCSHGAVGMSIQKGAPINGLYIFGGYAIDGAGENKNKGYLNDLFEFNFDTLKWRQVKAEAAPSPRSRFRMISYRESIYLFAGWNSTKHFSTLHRFNASTNQWSEIETDFDNDGIGQFSLVENNGIMYAFSGFSPNYGCRSNLFAYPLVPAQVLQSP